MIHPVGAMFGGVPGWVEVLVVLLVIMLLFGAKRLPDLARSLGRSMSEFKRGRQEGLKDDKSGDKLEDGKKDAE